MSFVQKFQLQLTKRCTDHPSTFVLSCIGSGFYKNTAFRWVHSEKVFQQPRKPALDAGIQGDENPNSSVVSKTMKLLGNGCNDYQSTDRSGHTATKSLKDKKTRTAIKRKLLKKLSHVNNALYEVELSTAENEHKEPIFIGIFVPRFAKLQLLEFHNFFFA